MNTTPLPAVAATATADPLAALPPLAAPAPVSWWPPAPGWWLLALVLCIALAWLLRAAARLLRRRRMQRWIQAQLELIYRRYKVSADRAAYLYEANLLLRRVWLAARPAGGCPQHSRNANADCDRDWLAQLDRLSRNAITNPAGMQLLLQYQPHPDADIEALDAALRTWCNGLRGQSLPRPVLQPRSLHKQPGLAQ